MVLPTKYQDLTKGRTAENPGRRPDPLEHGIRALSRGSTQPYHALVSPLHLTDILPDGCKQSNPGPAIGRQVPALYAAR